MHVILCLFGISIAKISIYIQYHYGSPVEYRTAACINVSLPTCFSGGKNNTHTNSNPLEAGVAMYVHVCICERLGISAVACDVCIT